MYSKNTLAGLLYPFLLLMYFNGPVKAQKNTAKIIPLQIGDVVPATLSGTAISAGSSAVKTIKIADYKGKLLILDFWATWCTACINNFPKIDSLQKNSGGTVDVLLVNNSDTRARVRDFFARGTKLGNTYPFPTLVNDVAVAASFPHTLIPHYVWIGPDGRVKAITGSEQLTAQNVQKVLMGDSGDLAFKEDLERSKPLLMRDHPALKQVQQYSILLKGRILGLPSGNAYRKEGGVIKGRMHSNSRLITLYQIAFKGIDPGYNSKRLFVEVTDSSGLFQEKSTLSKIDWEKANLYSYDLIVPVEKADQLYVYMLADLERYTPYRGFTEVRTVKSLSLRRTGDNMPVATKGATPLSTLFKKTDRTLVNQPIAKLVSWMGQRIPEMDVTNDTGFTGNIDLSLPDSVPETLEGIRAALVPFGLELREVTESKTCYIISDKKPNSK